MKSEKGDFSTKNQEKKPKKKKKGKIAEVFSARVEFNDDVRLELTEEL